MRKILLDDFLKYNFVFSCIKDPHENLRLASQNDVTTSQDDLQLYYFAMQALKLS